MTRRHFALACAGAAATAAAGAPPPGEYRRGGMTYRPLGRTGMYAGLLSFGSHTDPADRVKAPNGTVLTPAGQQRRDRIIARAFDLGVNLLDVYASEGQWEPAARLVKDRRDKVLISLAHEVTPADIDHACRLFGHVDLYRFATAGIDTAALENWDVLRKARESGKVRAIGIATHVERTMLEALQQLEGIDYLFIPYNFIHARADYAGFIEQARAQGTALIGMKPLASGSIMQLDPLARPGAKPEFDTLQLWQTRNRPILPAAVAELTRSLGRLPDETLCMAAMRFAFSRPFLGTVIAGMFEDRLLTDNYAALQRERNISRDEHAALGAARHLASLLDGRWLPGEYRWLEEQWSA